MVKICNPVASWVGSCKAHLIGLYKDERGITGLETAIVLIAFVVVASVFAFTVLSTGLYGTAKAKETVETGFTVAGSTLAKKGSTVLQGSDTVKTIKFKLANPTEGEPVDLDPERTMLTYSDGMNHSVGTYVETFPSPLVDEVYWKLEWPLTGTSGPTVDSGEVAEFTLDVSNLENPLGANSRVQLEILPVHSAVVPVSLTTPLELKPVMVVP